MLLLEALLAFADKDALIREIFPALRPRVGSPTRSRRARGARYRTRALTSRMSWSLCLAGTTFAEGERRAGLPYTCWSPAA